MEEWSSYNEAKHRMLIKKSEEEAFHNYILIKIRSTKNASREMIFCETNVTQVQRLTLTSSDELIPT